MCEWSCRQENINMKCKSGRAKALGTLCCLGGALILTLYKGMPLIDQSTPEVEVNHNVKSWIVGSSFLFAGSVVWSSWFLIQARIGKDYPYQYSSTAIMSFLGAIQSAILSLVIDRNTSTWFLKGTLEISTVIYAVSIVLLLSVFICLSYFPSLTPCPVQNQTNKHIIQSKPLYNNIGCPDVLWLL